MLFRSKVFLSLKKSLYWVLVITSVRYDGFSSIEYFKIILLVLLALTLVAVFTFITIITIIIITNNYEYCYHYLKHNLHLS